MSRAADLNACHISDRWRRPS